MAAPTLQNRVNNMGNNTSVSNPQFPPTFSLQNIKNFGSDLLGGAQYGAQGGIFGSNVGNALAPNKIAQIAQSAGNVNRFNNLPQLPTDVFGAPRAVPNTAPSFLQNISAGIKNAIPQAQEANKFFSQFQGNQGSPSPQQQLQQFSQPTPKVQQSPQVLSSNNASGGEAPYFSFEKFFTQSPGLRPLLGPATGMPQNGEEDEPTQVREQQDQQQQQQMEQWGEPESGFGKYAYRVSNWLHDSPWSQRLFGGAASLGATYLSGGALAPFSTAIGTGAGALFKGLTGQLKNFFAARTDQPQVQPQTAQPSILNQPKLGIA